MKIFLTALIIAACFGTNAQRSEDLVPAEAVSVFSINNINLLQKISLDQLVQYEFMEEVQQELFDGSTSGKTLKDSGIDFNQKLNIFIGRGDNYLITGMTFGVVSKTELFEVFDDFEPIESEFAGVEMFASYFNRIAIKGSVGVLFRIEPLGRAVDQVTDSIWYAQGNDYPWYDDFYYEEEYYEEEWEEGTWEEGEWEEAEIEFTEEMEIEENTTTPIDEEDNLPEAGEDPTTKTYFELRDSVEMAFLDKYLNSFCADLFLNDKTLVNSSPEFSEHVKKEAEGTFFIDNSNALINENEFGYMNYLYPGLVDKMNELYSNNLTMGEIHINDNSIELVLDAKYGPELGAVYNELTDAKFDKNVVKYISNESQSFFTYNVNMRKAYEEAYKVILPIIAESDNKNISALALTFELMDEFMNKDAIFDAYKGSMFGSFNGIQKIMTKKIIFDYDYDTFEYSEKEVEAEEDMPIFVFGFSTERHDIGTKVLNHLCKVYDAYHDMGEYYLVDNAILNSAPLYIINKNGLFIYTNDENLAKNHSDGYGKNTVSKKQIKKGMKGGAVYAHADLSKAIEQLPKEIFNNRENEMIDFLRGKSGSIELTSSKTTVEKTSFNLSYQFEGDYESSGTYILDLINSMYVISK